MSAFLKGLLRNLAFLIGLGVLLLVLFPDLMKQAYQLPGGLFGPLVILIVIVTALPHFFSMDFLNPVNLNSLSILEQELIVNARDLSETDSKDNCTI